MGDEPLETEMTEGSNEVGVELSVRIIAARVKVVHL
jgi:hypothetical protein